MKKENEENEDEANMKRKKRETKSKKRGEQKIVVVIVIFQFNIQEKGRLWRWYNISRSGVLGGGFWYPPQLDYCIFKRK